MTRNGFSHRKIFLVGIVIGCQAICPSLAQEEDPDLNAIRLLRSQRKFSEVEKRINDIQSDLTSKQFAKKVLLEIERIQSKMASSFEKEPASRIQSLQSISGSIDKFVTNNFDNPNIVLVESQKAFATLSFGELLRMEIEAGVLRESNAKVAFQILREADRLFESVDKKLAEMIPDQPKKPKDNSLSQRHLISLQNQIRYKRIKSKMNRGLLYGKSDPDNSVAIISTCKSELRRILPLIDKVDEAWWKARLDYLVCHRMTSDFRNAYILFQSYPIKESPPENRLAFKAEMVRLALDSNQIKKAEDLIASGREIEGKELADFDYAILEFFLRKKELTQDQQDKRNIQDTLVKIVKAIESKHGTYWGRRANMALLSSAKMFGASGSTTLIRLAQDHYRKKEYDAAIVEFEKAATAARKELNRRLELELRFQAVTIHNSLGQHVQVVQKAKSIASDFKDTNRAAVVHLVGILSAAEIVRKSDRESYQTNMDKYLDMLGFHLSQWPQHQTVGKVGFFRGEYKFANRDIVGAATDLKKSIKAMIDDERALDLDLFEKSISLLSRSFERIRSKMDGTKELKAFKEQFQGGEFFSQVFQKTSSLPSTLSCWASFALEIDEGLRGVVFEELIKETEPSGELLSKLIRLATVTSKVDLVTDFPGKLKLVKADDQEALFDGFGRDWKRSSRVVRRKIANAVIQIDLTASVKNDYWELLAESYILLNKPDDALKVLELAKEKSKAKLRPRIMIAQVQSQSPVKEWNQRGLESWRDILTGVKANSEYWFEAKYEIARLHHKLGDADKALKMLQLMKAVPPGWSKSTRAKEFDTLLAELLR